MDGAGASVPLSGVQKRVVLALLGLHAGAPVGVEQLIDRLWPADPPRHARKTVQVYAGALRRELAVVGLTIVGGAGGYRLARIDEEPAVWGHRDGADPIGARPDELTDVQLAERLLAQARQADRPLADRLARYRGALALWRGEPLAELAHLAELQPFVVRFAELRLAAQQELLALELRSGARAPGAVAAELESLLGHHRWHEGLWALLMEALYRQGRQADALAAYGRARRALDDELGLEPTAALRELERRILQQDPTLDADPAVPTTAASTTGAPSPTKAPGPPVSLEERPPSRRGGIPHALRFDDVALVGRRAELGRLGELAWAARRDGGRLVLIGGDPGIGKTRLAAEVARQCALDGAAVGYGRAEPGRPTPYHVLAQALGALVRTAPAGLIEAHLARHGDGLGRIVPALHRRTTATPTTPPPEDRAALFDAAVGLVEALAETQPVILVLDDLHDAGPETLDLLRSLLDALDRLPVLVLGTYRDAETEADSPLAALVSRGRRRADALVLRLDGLGPDAVGELAAQILPAEPPGEPARRPELLRWIGRETGGNPLFVLELLRTLAPDAAEPVPVADAWLALPATDTIRDVIGRRADRLPAATREVLAVAAVAGRRFDLAVIAAVLGRDEGDVLDAIELALTARLVDEAEAPGCFSFAHGLINQVLESRQTRTRRARTHRSLADALERQAGLDGADTGEDAEEALARHLVGAGRYAEPDRVVAAARRAGDRALLQLAPERAVHWYREALARAGDEPARRAELLVALGRAQRQAGLAEHRETLLEAGRLAIAGRDPARLFDAVLANYRGKRSASMSVDDERVAQLRAAVELAGDDDSPALARTLAVLASEVSSACALDERLALTDRALRIARRLGDPEVVCDVLSARLEAVRTPETLALRNEESAEMVALAEALGDPRRIGFAHLWRARARLEHGDLAGFDDSLARSADALARFREPWAEFALAVNAASRAVVAGELEHAERLTASARHEGLRTAQENVERTCLVVGLTIDDARGTIGGAVLDALSRLADAQRELDGLAAAAAFGEAAAGRLDAGPAGAALLERARARLERFDADRLAALPRDQNWLCAVQFLARATIATAHRPLAGPLAELLAPWAGQVVSTAASVHGQVTTLLSGLALVHGDVDGAVGAARRARAEARRAGSPLWTAEALHALVEADPDPAHTDAARAELAALVARHGFGRFAPTSERIVVHG